jgi:hypothetical protein
MNVLHASYRGGATFLRVARQAADVRAVVIRTPGPGAYPKGQAGAAAHIYLHALRQVSVYRLYGNDVPMAQIPVAGLSAIPVATDEHDGPAEWRLEGTEPHMFLTGALRRRRRRCDAQAAPAAGTHAFPGSPNGGATRLTAEVPARVGDTVAWSPRHRQVKLPSP